MAIIFRFAERELELSSDQAHWLLGQIWTAVELTPAAAAVAAKIEQSLGGNGAVETTLAEKRELIAALERGSMKPRSHELRAIEIGLHTAVYADTYLKDQ